MKTNKKWIALLACMFMLLSLSIGALAEKPATPYSRAIDEGKSASFTTDISWGSPSFLDEDTNALLALALGAVSVSGFHGTLENGDRFNSIDFNMNGNSVLPFDVYATDEGVFINSPIYGGAVAIAEEEVPALFEVIVQAFDTMFADQLPSDMSFADVIAQVMETVDKQMEALESEPAEAEAVIAQFGLEELIAALDAWADGFVGTPYDGGEAADFGEDVAEVLVYELSREQIIELFETVLPLILENEIFWRAVIEQLQQQGADVSAQFGVSSAEEIMEKFAELDLLQQIRDNVPEATAFNYVEYLDAEGVILLAQAQLNMEDYICYLEWVPGGNNVFLVFGEEANNVTFIISTADTITETLGTLETVEDASFIALTVIADSEPAFTLGLSFSKQTATDEDLYESSSAIGIDLEAMGGFEGTAQIILSNVSAGGDQATDITSLSVFVFDELAFTFTLTKETGNIAPRFDPASYDGEIVHPAQMDAEAFTAWTQTVVEDGLQQTLLRLMGSIPPELLGSMPMGAF